MAAQNEARAAGNAEIRPEHLVLSLLSEPDALAAMSILAQGVTLETVRQAATATLPRAADQVSALVPFDPQSRRSRNPRRPRAEVTWSPPHMRVRRLVSSLWSVPRLSSVPA